MRHEIKLDAEAEEDLSKLRAAARSAVCEALERYLRHEPTKVSKTRIKRLRGMVRPQYRLRVGDDLRVYYDVNPDGIVEVIAILRKSETLAWLAEHGEADETDRIEPDE